MGTEGSSGSTGPRGGRREGMIEAMASGVPLIATRTPDTERVIRNGANGLLVQADQPVDMARVAHALLNRPEQARAFGVEGEAEVGRYPLAGLAVAVAGVYHTLTSSDPPRCE